MVFIENPRLKETCIPVELQPPNQARVDTPDSFLVLLYYTPTQIKRNELAAPFHFSLIWMLVELDFHQPTGKGGLHRPEGLFIKKKILRQRYTAQHSDSGVKSSAGPLPFTQA